jgi:uncharacterized protein|tara:strand:+ start:1676 stop:2182 length:507 start_codon:yes stop_codon:yes gene_type:complete
MIEFNLFRDDLESGLNHQSFEVQANNLDDGALSFSNDKIQCYLSSEKQWHGFLLKGEISFSFLVLCDRCVSKYEDKQNSSFEIVLTDNNDLLQKKSDDILRFDKSEKLIDIGPLIRDQILMTEPIKKVCNSDCKGICQYCGQNQNENSCNCDNKQPTDDVWENLKQFV